MLLGVVQNAKRFRRYARNVLLGLADTLADWVWWICDGRICVNEAPRW